MCLLPQLHLRAHQFTQPLRSAVALISPYVYLYYHFYRYYYGLLLLLLGRGHTQNFSLFFTFFSLGSEKILRSHTPERKIFTFEVKNFLAVTHKIFH